MDGIVEQAVEAFRARFHTRPEVVARAPGRVNLIGEHTDYNEGFVFPAAIDRWVVFAARPRCDGRAVLRWVAHPDEDAFETGRAVTVTKTWADYPRGVVREFQERNLAVGGFDAILAGDVPVGAGLSSSAAVELAVGKGLAELNGHALKPTELALLGQRAENRFVGVQCGIMDQFASANGRVGHALFLDCRDLSFEPVLLGGEVRIVICNSGVGRELAGSAYNARRAACEAGVRLLSEAMGRGLRALRDVLPEDLEAHREGLPREIYRRCRHVVTENARVQEAVRLLEAGDATGFGSRMVASHGSLRDDYEVSGPELDVLVEITLSVPGVLGARMTGAGFGGCTVNLVRENAVEALTEAVRSRYPERTGREPEVYVCSAVDGAECVV